MWDEALLFLVPFWCQIFDAFIVLRWATVAHMCLLFALPGPCFLVNKVSVSGIKIFHPMTLTLMFDLLLKKKLTLAITFERKETRLSFFNSWHGRSISPPLLQQIKHNYLMKSISYTIMSVIPYSILTYFVQQFSLQNNILLQTVFVHFTINYVQFQQRFLPEFHISSSHQINPLQ